MKIYKELFYERDESFNKEQHYDKLLAIDQFRPEVERGLLHDVDNILRNELIYLKLSIDNVKDQSIRKRKHKKKTKKRKKKRQEEKWEAMVADCWKELLEDDDQEPVTSK